MRELVDFLIKQLIDEGSYEIVILEDENEVIIKVFADSNNIARLIGKSGRVAKAIRTIVKAVGQRCEKKYNIFIEEKEVA